MTISYTQNTMKYTLSVNSTLTVNSPDLEHFYFSMKVADLADTIDTFIKKELRKLGSTNQIHSNDIMEILKNSRESFCDLSSGITREIDSFLEIKVKVNLNKDRDYVIIKIKDNANGITGKSKGQFFSVKECKSTKNRKGTPRFFSGGLGLGLEQFKKFVERQNGTIQLKNRKLAGCAIYIQFPLNRTQPGLSDLSSVSRIEEKAALSLTAASILTEKKKDILRSKKAQEKKDKFHEPLQNKLDELSLDSKQVNAVLASSNSWSLAKSNIKDPEMKEADKLANIYENIDQANAIDNSNNKSYELRNAIGSLLEIGHIETATKVANTIPDLRIRSISLESIVRAWIDKKDMDKATEVANTIPEVRMQSISLESIVSAWIDKKDMGKATEVANTIPDLRMRSIALHNIERSNT